MAVTADIQINGSPGSNDNLPLGTLVSLSNVSPSPVSSYEWAILSQPEGTSTDALSSTTSATPTFTPTKEGSYLLRLIVDKTLPTEATQQVIAAVRELETEDRIPAAGETLENNGTTGWANTATDYILQRVTRLLDAGVVVGQAGAAGLTAGTVLRATGVTTIGVDPANQRVVPVFTVINATTDAVLEPELVVLLAGVDGNPAPANGALIRARYSGLVQGVLYPSTPPAVGDAVFVNDIGTLALTQGTVERPCGTVAAVNTGAGTYDVFFGGGISSRDGGSPGGAAGGALQGTYPDPLIADGVVPYDFMLPLQQNAAPLGGNFLFQAFVVGRDCQFAVAAEQQNFYVNIAPTSQYIVGVFQQVFGGPLSLIGTITFDAGAYIGVFAWQGGFDRTASPNDILIFLGQSAGDPTVRQLFGTLKATVNY